MGEGGGGGRRLCALSGGGKEWILLVCCFALHSPFVLEWWGEAVGFDL